MTKVEMQIGNALPSADARYIAGRIITHMWIIWVVIPLALALVYLLLTAVLR
jgi:hypothetical protein